VSGGGAAPHRGWSDQQVEQTVGNLLRVGLLIATAVVLVGAAIYLANFGGQRPDDHIFRGEPPDLRGIRGIIGLAAEWRGRGIIQLGLLLLLATPVARVAFSIVAFALQRDRLYVTITCVVLAVLLYSMIGGYE
jgi:uncharacterized membrane protein